MSVTPSPLASPPPKQGNARIRAAPSWRIRVASEASMIPSQFVSPGSGPSTSEMGLVVGVGGTSCGVHVGTGVQVGTGVHVGSGVAVLAGGVVCAPVSVDVAVAVAVAVAVGVVPAGEINVIEPLVVVAVSDEPPVSSSRTADSVRVEIPAETVENCTRARLPSSFGPGCAPAVEHPNVTLLASVVGGGHVTERPVEPRKALLVALMKASTPASQVSLKS